MSRPVVDPSTFTDEQWRAVRAFADAQAQANFAYQRQLPTQHLAESYFVLRDTVWALLVGFSTLVLATTIGFGVFHAWTHSTAGSVVGAAVGFVVWLIFVVEHFRPGFFDRFDDWS